MAEQNNTTTPRPCPKDCRRCGMQQQIFCAAQLGYMQYEQNNILRESFNALEEKLNTLAKKIEAIQCSEAELAIPLSNSEPTHDLFTS